MKKKLAIISLAVAASLCLTSFSVFAGDKDIPLTSATGSEISSSLKQCLEELDVYVDAETKIELSPTISSARSSGGNALIITNADEGTITKDVLLFVDDEGNVGLDDLNEITPRAGITVPSDSSEKRLTIRGTAVFNEIDGLDYQPQGAKFTYKKNKECDVSNICVSYITDGYKYSYPDKEQLSTDITTYIIEVDEDNPYPSTIYAKSRPFPSTMYLHIGTGGVGMIGMFLNFSWTIDGRTLDHSVLLVG